MESKALQKRDRLAAGPARFLCFWLLFFLLLAASELGLAFFDRPGLTTNEKFWMSLYYPEPVFVRRPSGTWELSERLVDLDNRPRSFTDQPAPGALRILCVGGSSTAGWPFQPKGGYPQWLGLMLSDALGRPVEIVNAGILSYGVHQDLRILRQLQRLHWDLVIAYEGHNLEFTAAECKPFFPRWRFEADLWLLRRSRLYRLLKSAVAARRPGIQTEDSPPIYRTAYRECLARNLADGLKELGALSHRQNWRVLLVAPIRHGGIPWEGNEISVSLAGSARQEDFLYLDALPAVQKILPSEQDLTVGDGVHPTLRAQWAVGKALCYFLARKGWPDHGALRTERLKSFQTYRTRLQIDVALMAKAHAYLGFMFLGLHDAVHAQREFSSAERLKSGVLLEQLGGWSSTAYLRGALQYYESRRNQTAAAKLLALLRSRRSL